MANALKSAGVSFTSALMSTSSVRDVALAEISSDAPGNARLIAGNVTAMREALSSSDVPGVEQILDVRRALIGGAGLSFGGRLRGVPVWIGGSAYSPHGASYVPPRWELVPGYLEDLVAFAARDDVNPIAQAAIVHAQFESIHPFIDGNGRVGRTLIHKVLRRRGVLKHSTLPVSAGLLHDTDAYTDSIARSRQGDLTTITEQLVGALELAVFIGNKVSVELDEVIEGWRGSVQERKGSSIWRLPDVLVEQPVVNVAYVAEAMDITQRATRSLIDRACEYGILRPMGNKHRGECYQADSIIGVLEEASSLQGIRQMLSTGK